MRANLVFGLKKEIRKELRMNSKSKGSSDANRPAALGGAPVFVQTVQTPEFPKLDDWKQITEEEAQVALQPLKRKIMLQTWTLPLSRKPIYDVAAHSLLEWIV